MILQWQQLHLVGAQADAMKTAAGNEAGAMTGFHGQGMAMNAAGGGMNAQNLFAMGQQQQAQQAAQQQAVPTPQPGTGTAGSSRQQADGNVHVVLQ